ncbi:hypothetical protein QBC34DRAFT_471872 [Podospora aff. communis PSN243]|uniref:Uncharacterized protein n=1 Tax=Podospora aff. communis PSN243 TaxID=3040156 RepID=A0AAV9GCR7_9PEZI|nr:hypothetical protein QBC34DRAFT_471872 [Podospora aff. communis PSN243]
MLPNILTCLLLFPSLTVAGSKTVLRPFSRHGKPRPFKPGHGAPHFEPDPYGGNGTSGGPLTEEELVLRDHEQLLWGSPNDTAVSLASVRITPFPGQRIIDMERFIDGISEATCSEDMILRFSQRQAFVMAQTQWNWVNLGANRAFVLVSDPALCSSGISRDPWLVSHIAFDPAALVIRLDAVKKMWSEVTYEYELNFGAALTRPTPNKRALLDFAYDGAYEIPLTTPFPTDLFAFTAGDSGAANFKFDVKCQQCGIFGKLAISGYAAGNYLTGVKQVDFSVRPFGVRADLNLELFFSGQYQPGMYGLPDIKAVQPLLDKSLLALLPAGWLIDGLVDLGPAIRIEAGVELESLSGTARLGAGLTATVPEDSVARLALKSEDVLQVDGWIPDIEVKPISLEAQVTAIVKLYTQIVPSFDCVIFGQHGFRAGLPLKLPKMEVNITTGSDPNGFCPGDPRPTGIRVQGTLGVEFSAAVAERMAPGVSQLSGKAKENVRLFEPAVKEQIHLDKELLTLPLASRGLVPRIELGKGEITVAEKKIFDKPVRSFDPWCRSWGEPCLFVPEESDQAWYDIEIDSAEDAFTAQPPVTPRRTLFPRRESPKFVCKGQPTPYASKPYPGPKLVKDSGKAGGSNVPILLPSIKCDATKCPADDWNIKLKEDPDVVDIPLDNPKKTIWSMEHIYELNWLSRFWQSLNTTEGVTCSALTGAPPGISIGHKGGFAEEMQLAVGNLATYLDTMVLLPKRENLLKHQMFAIKELDRSLTVSTTSTQRRACSIGRIVSVCKMMDELPTQKRLKNTLSNLDKVFKTMQPSAATGLEPLTGGKTYLKAHQEWFTQMYNNGIEWTRERLNEYASSTVKRGLDGLDPKTAEAIESIAKARSEAEWKEFCPNSFKYPGYTPDPSTSSDPSTPSEPPNSSQPPTPSEPPTTPSEPPTSNPNNAFVPPFTTPVSGLTSTWDLVLYDYPFLNTGTDPIEEDKLLKYDGKATANTRCIEVGEFTSILSGVTYLNQRALFEWTRGEGDSCCLVVFREAGCKAAGERREFCPGGTDYRMPFDAWSVMVYGCKGFRVGA